MHYCSVHLLFLSLCVQLISSDYQKISTDYFDFFFKVQDKKIVEVVSKEADTIAGEMSADLAVAVKERITVCITEDFELNDVQPHYIPVPDWVTGIAYHRLSMIYLKSPRAISGMHYDLKKTFVHELSHVLLGSALGNATHIPQWLNEGVAMYQSREWSFNRVSTMTQAVITDSLIPLSDITSGFPLERTKSELAYCQSFYLISFLITEYGRKKFHDFIRCYTRGSSLEDALLKVYSLNLHQLEEMWYSYLKLRFSWIPIITSTTTLWFLITLIFLYGYIKKRRSARMTLHQWDEDEI